MVSMCYSVWFWAGGGGFHPHKFVNQHIQVLWVGVTVTCDEAVVMW
jgi:hypothetical protein